MTSYSRVRGFFVMGSLFLWLGIQAYGQGTQSTILGSVTDSSGGAVPGATVTVKNQGTGIERSLATNESGDYRIAGLEAGVYQVSITVQGFKSYVRTDIDLNVSQIKRVDAALEVGAVTSAITVRGGPGQVETETATLSNVKPARDFIELPLSVFGRGDTNILVVAAGYNSVGCCDVVINGSRGGAFNLTADGAADVDGAVPRRDARRERRRRVRSRGAGSNLRCGGRVPRRVPQRRARLAGRDLVARGVERGADRARRPAPARGERHARERARALHLAHVRARSASTAAFTAGRSPTRA